MKKHVLIIDDDAGIRYLLRTVLEQEEYDVLEAENGSMALQRLEQCIPDLILLDLMMPVMDGYTFLKQLHACERTAYVPVLVITADVQARTRMPDLVVAGWIMKPFHIRSLMAQVREVLAQPASSLPLHQHHEV